MPATRLLINIDLTEGKTADAIARARDLATRYPNDDSTHVELGQLLACLTGSNAPCTPDRPAAFAEFSQAITLHPTAFAYAMRSQVRPLTDTAARHADLDAALALEPNNTIALLTRSALYLYEHDDAKGLADADTVLARTPADLQALNLRAKLLGQLKRYDEEMKALDAELKLNPDNADALNSQCWSRAVRNVELTTALDNCNAAIRLSPIANYYDSRALVYRRLGKLDDALADYNTALAKTPDLAGSLYGRGLIEIIKGQAEAGRADIAKALAIRPQAGDAFKEMGLAPDQPAGAAAKP
jgi:tetratricopeptide (TPR) repeat protein